MLAKYTSGYIPFQVDIILAINTANQSEGAEKVIVAEYVFILFEQLRL